MENYTCPHTHTFMLNLPISLTHTPTFKSDDTAQHSASETLRALSKLRPFMEFQMDQIEIAVINSWEKKYPMLLNLPPRQDLNGRRIF